MHAYNEGERFPLRVCFPGAEKSTGGCRMNLYCIHTALSLTYCLHSMQHNSRLGVAVSLFSEEEEDTELGIYHLQNLTFNVMETGVAQEN